MDMHNITALTAFALGVLVGRAYVPALRAQLTPPANALAWGFLWFAAGSIGRSLYWSVPRLFLGDHWPLVRDRLGGLGVNILFDAALVVGLLLMLRARLLAIPADERRHYNLLTCITYPEPFRISSIIGRSPK